MKTKLLRKKDIPQYISDILLFLTCFMIFVVRIINNSETTQSIALGVLVITGTIGILWLFHDKKSFILLYIFFASIGWGFTYLMRTYWQYDFIYFLNSIMYMGAAYIFLRYEQNEKSYMILFCLVVIYVIFAIQIRGDSIRGFMKDGTSYNYISVICLFFLTLYSLVRISKGKGLSYLQAIIFFYVAIISYGRGGIITAGSFLICTALGKILENRKQYKTHLILIILILITLLFGEQIADAFLGTGYFAKFQRYRMETGRTYIWSVFWEQSLSNIPSFIIGEPPIDIVPDGNLHNSFFQMYVSFGIVFFLLNVYLIVVAVIQNIKKKQYWLLFLFMVFFVRAFLDRLMYRGYMEIAYYYFIFDYLNSKNTMHNSIKRRELEGTDHFLINL